MIFYQSMLLFHVTTMYNYVVIRFAVFLLAPYYFTLPFNWNFSLLDERQSIIVTH